MIKDLAGKGKSAYAIGQEIGISKNTARKYMEQADRQHGLKGISKGSKLDPYKPQLNEWMEQGIFNAKAAFDKRKLKKLPKVKELSAEYQELLAEKRKLYPEYRRAREEMRELLTVKANVDQLLNRWEKKERILDDSREK